MQTASELEFAKLPLSRNDVEDIKNVRKKCHTIRPNHFGKIHKCFKEKWLELENKGLVLYDSQDQDAFELDRKDERGKGLDVK